MLFKVFLRGIELMLFTVI